MFCGESGTVNCNLLLGNQLVLVCRHDIIVKGMIFVCLFGINWSIGRESDIFLSENPVFFRNKIRLVD